MTTLRTERLGWSVDGYRVLDGVDVDVAEGRVTGLLGPSGSGKTTLLHLLAGLRRPTTGRVLVDGTDVRELGNRLRAQLIALVEQQAATILPLRVTDVVALGRLPYRSRLGGGLRDPAGRAAIRRALNTAQADSLAERRWNELSGGERQRVHLARALAQEPRILLLDEPTNHLDLGLQLSFLARVRDLGLTVVAALHDLELAAAYCDDLIVLDQGSVVATGPAGDVLSAELLARVYGVEATVERHPRTPRPHVVWDRHLEH